MLAVTRLDGPCFLIAAIVLAVRPSQFDGKRFISGDLVKTIRMISEVVSPRLSSTKAALSFTEGSMRARTYAFAAIFASFSSLIFM